MLLPTRAAVLRRALAVQWRPAAGGAALLVSWQTGEALVPVALGAIVDRAIRPGDGAALLVGIAALGGLFLVLSLSFRFGSRLARRAYELSAHDARVRLAGAVLDLRNRPDPSRGAGTLVSVASSDAERVGIVAALVAHLSAAVVSVLVAAVVVLRISTPVGLLVLAGCPILLVLVHLLGAPLEKRASTEQASAAQAAGLATDLVTGIRVLKGIGAESAAADRYADASRRSLAATLRAARAGSLYAAATLLLTMLFLAVVTLVAGRLAAAGRISVGELIAAVGLAQFLIAPLSRLGYIGADFAQARASATRIADVHRALRHPSGSSSPPAPLRGQLDWRLGAGTLTASAGEILGVVADPDEAARLVDQAATAAYADTDDVHLDGTPLRALAPHALAEVLLVARHDSDLFAGSVRDNLRASDRRVGAVLDAACLDVDLDTVVGERGHTLSGGQRQRVALARALAADPPVLVLHDPTTAVDAATESRIAAGLRQDRVGRTTVLVTTSPALLAACDRVVLVRGGTVRAVGTHADLSANEPDYRELVFA